MKKMFLAIICLAVVTSTAFAKDEAVKDEAVKSAVKSAVKFAVVQDEQEVAVPAGNACACAKVVLPTPAPTPDQTITGADDGIGLVGDDKIDAVTDAAGGGSINSDEVNHFPEAAPGNTPKRPVRRMFRR